MIAPTRRTIRRKATVTPTMRPSDTVVMLLFRSAAGVGGVRTCKEINKGFSFCNDEVKRENHRGGKVKEVFQFEGWHIGSGETQQ